jgi:hypothetical protein
MEEKPPALNVNRGSSNGCRSRNQSADFLDKPTDAQHRVAQEEKREDKREPAEGDVSHPGQDIQWKALCTVEKEDERDEREEKPEEHAQPRESFRPTGEARGRKKPATDIKKCQAENAEPDEEEKKEAHSVNSTTTMCVEFRNTVICENPRFGA